jgi:hypothetical protein
MSTEKLEERLAKVPTLQRASADVKPGREDKTHARCVDSSELRL